MENEGAFGFRGEGFVQVLHQSVETGLRGQVHADLKKDHRFSLQAGNERGVSVELIKPTWGEGEFCFDEKNSIWTFDPEVRDMELVRRIHDPALGDEGELKPSGPVSN